MMEELLYIDQTYLYYIWLFISFFLGIGLVVAPIVRVVRLNKEDKKKKGIVVLIISIVFWIGTLVLYFAGGFNVAGADSILDCNGTFIWLYSMFVVGLQIIVYWIILLAVFIVRLKMKKNVIINVICLIFLAILLVSLFRYTYYHNQHYAIDNRAFIGKSLDEIEQKYGKLGLFNYIEGDEEKTAYMSTERLLGYELGFDYSTIYFDVDKNGIIINMELGLPLGG